MNARRFFSLICTLWLLLYSGTHCGVLRAEPPAPPTPTEESRALPSWAIENEPPPAGDFKTEFFKMLTVLGTLLAVLFLITWGIRSLLSQRMIKENETSGIKILERRSIGTKAAFILIEIEGKRFLVGESPQGISLIGTWDKCNFKEELERVDQ